MSKVRIVGGTHRSRLIEVPDSIALRPTPDRVRETLFNWLGQDLDGLTCLDLFAGSGVLGFEAASRGAASVVMVEFMPKVAAQLRASAARLGLPAVRLVTQDAVRFLQTDCAPFDLVFLDPPYRQGWLERLAPVIGKVLAPGGRIYVEAETPLQDFAGLVCIKSGKAGQVHYHLFAPPDTEDSHG